MNIQETNFQQVVLDKINIGARFSLDELDVLESKYEIDTYGNIGRGLAISLQGYVWGKHNRDVVYTYPADWKEAFKERWFPEWLKRRYPVKYKKITIDSNTLYPTIRHVVPQHTPSLVYRIYEGETYGREKY